LEITKINLFCILCYIIERSVFSMKVLIAMDSFKGNLGSLDVARVVEEGIRRVYEDADIDKVAIADGGEGTVEAIVNCLKGEYVKLEVEGPLNKKTVARYGIVKGETAIIEMAEASGLFLISEEERNPLKTSTFGTGQLILDALERGCNKIVMGIGGSATNDGGLGMAKALGAMFLDKNGEAIGEGGGSLDKLEKIDLRNLHPRLKSVEFLVACDVNNPLCGEKGASAIYGPQKGATTDIISQLDKNLSHYADIIKRDVGVDVKDVPGAGAAGGLGAALIAFCGGRLLKGVEIVLDIVNIDERIKNVDVVITGEGRIDAQTANGKVPVGIAGRAKKYNKPVFAIAGFIDNGAELVYKHGIDSIMSSMVGPISVEESMNQSRKLIADASERLFRIIHAIKRS
jgi:glycerate kinase